MATAERLINDAQYALGNVSPGSSDEKKYASRARRLASQILSKYPGTIEAQQAHAILLQLGDQGELRVPLEVRHHKHRTDAPLAVGANKTSPPVTTRTATTVSASSSATTRRKPSNDTPGNITWNAIWRKIVDLPYAKKKVLFFVVFFLSLIITSFPFLALALFFYFAKPSRFKEHLYKFIGAFE